MDLVFVGEKRSNRAIAMGVTWEDGRLAAKVLHEALTSAGVEPAQVRFVNLFRDGEGLAWDDRAIEVIEVAAAMGWTVIGMGRLVQRELTRLGIPHRPMVHPAARGSIRRSDRYRAHVAEVLHG